MQEALTLLTQKHPAIGFWQCCYRLWNKDYPWNHKKIYRVYTAMKLNIRRRAKKRLPERVKQPLRVPTAPKQVWSLDFMSNSTYAVKNEFSCSAVCQKALATSVSRRKRRKLSEEKKA